MIEVYRQTLQYGTTSASVELASTTIFGGKVVSLNHMATTSAMGDFAEDNFDPAAKEAALTPFAPGEYIVFTQNSSNNDNETSIGQPHSIAGTCEAVFLKF